MEPKKRKSKEQFFDIRRFLFSLLGKWYIFLLFGVLGYYCAKLYLRYEQDIFYSRTSLLLKPNNSGLSSIIGIGSSKGSNIDVQDEIQLIKSNDLISKVVKELEFDVSYFHIGNIRTIEFYKDSPIQVVLDSNSFQIAEVPFFITLKNANTFELRANALNAKIYDVNRKTVEGTIPRLHIRKTLKFGEPYVDRKNNVSFRIYLKDPSYKQDDAKLYFYINDHEKITRVYKNQLQISPLSKESDILNLGITGPLVRKNIDFLNKVTEVYIRVGLEEKNRMITNSIRFIEEQLAVIGDSIRRAEMEVEEFRSKNKAFNFGESYNSSTEKLADLEKQKAAKLLELQYYRYVENYIREKKDFDNIVVPSSIGLEDKILNKLIEEIIKLRSERNVLIQTTAPTNPYVKQIDTKIETATQSLYENVKNILEVSYFPINEINREISEIEQQLQYLPEKDRIWLDIQRRVNLNNHLYNYLLERKAEAGITKASTKPDHQIVESASVLDSFKVAPNVSAVYNVAIFLGLAVPFIFLLLVQLLNTKIVSKEDLLRNASIPLLGAIGHKEGSSNLVVHTKPKSSISEGFRSLRMNLEYMAPDVNKKIISVTSSISGEGKTFLSINLANIIAITGKKTLLIGADLRKPKIYDDLNISNSKGLSTYLAGKSTSSEIICSTDIPNLEAILAGPVPPNPAELLGSERMVKLIRELLETYDAIVIDTPPIGLVADAFSIMKFSDINLYMVRHNYTRYKMLEKVNALYEEGRIKNLSLIINDVRAKDEKYYGYGGAYGYGYGYGYGNGYYEVEKSSAFSFLKRVKKKIRV